MKTNLFAKAFSLLALSAAAASAQQYVAVDLSPNASNGALGFAVSGTTGGGSVMALGPQGAYVQHGALFSGGTITDIHPSSWAMSVILSMSATQQVGEGLPSASADASSGVHAMLWSGSAASLIDLNPNSFAGSAATCTTGFMQGGYGFLKVKSSGKTHTLPPTHALIWFGASNTYQDLNPSTAAESRINGCSGGQEVGYIMPISPGFTHAAVWFGTGAAAVDLQPLSGFVSSTAFGAAGFQQAGYGVTDSANGGAGHALLWTGSASSMIDLHPAGYTFSVAYATNGLQQVGEADDSALPRHKHAIVWSGSASTAVDLNQFLPAGYTDAQAMAIDSNGNIVGYAGNHAFLWMPVR